MRKNVESLINSSITAHQVAADTGLPRNTVYRIFTGETELSNVKFGTIEKLNKYWKGLVEEIENIKKVIAGVENGEIELESLDPKYYEEEYIDSPNSIWIVHTVEGHDDLEVFFAEREEFAEVRQQIYDGEADESAFDELVYNEYADRFDYDNVVAYRTDDGEINWI